MKAWKLAPKLYDALHGKDGNRKILKEPTKEQSSKGWRKKLGKAGEAIPIIPMPTIKNLKKALESFGRRGKFVAGMVGSVALLVGHFAKLTFESDNFRKGLVKIGEAFGKVFAFFKEHGIVGGFVELFAKLFDVLGKLMPEFSFTKKFFEFFAGVLRNLKDRLQPIFSLFDGFGTDIAMIASALALISNPIGWIIGGLELVSLAIRGIGWATKDAVAPVEVLTDEISDLTRQKLKPILDDFEELDKKVQDITLGDKLISEEDITEVTTKVKTLSEAIVKELDAKHNKALADLKPLEKTLDPAVYKKMVAEVNKSHDDRVKKVKETQDAIQGILRKAQSENRSLNQAEVEAIKKHEETIKNLMVNTMASTEQEIKLISERIRNNQSVQALKSADEVIKASKTARDERIKNAEAVYQNTLDIASRSNLSVEEYEKVKKKATETRTHEISEAIVAYTQISDKVKNSLGEDAKHYDFLEGHIKSKWQEIKESASKFIDDFTSEMAKGWEDFKKSTIDTFEGTKKSISDKMDEIKTTVKSKLETYVTLTAEGWENVKNRSREKLDNLKTLTSQKYEEMKNNIKTSYESWQKLTEENWEAIKTKTFEKIAYIRDRIKPKLDEIKGKMKTWADEKVKLIEESWLGKSGVWEKIKKGAKYVADNLPSALSAIGNAWSNFWSGLGSVIKGMGELVSSKFYANGVELEVRGGFYIPLKIFDKRVEIIDIPQEDILDVKNGETINLSNPLLRPDLVYYYIDRTRNSLIAREEISLDWRADPRLDVGDIVRHYDDKVLFVTESKITFNGSFRGSLKGTIWDMPGVMGGEG